MKFLCAILPILVLTTSSILLTHAHDIKVVFGNNCTDAEARRRWHNEFGEKYVVELFQKEIIPFIWKTFNQDKETERKMVRSMGVIAKPLRAGAMAETGENNIYVNQNTIASFSRDPKRAKFEFKSLMYHEGTHIFQWNGEGSCPGGLTEGIAHYVMVKAGAFDEYTFTKPGEGKEWDEGYGVTERFLEYCDELTPFFTPKLNNKMRKIFKVDYFKELTGKTVEQLWSDYKKKYGKIPGQP